MDRKTVLPNITLFWILILLWGCSNHPKEIQTALESIHANDLKAHIAVLASDEFQGRFPMTKGEDLTIQYLQTAFEKIGCQPGNGQSYFQAVPLVETVIDPKAQLTISGREKLKFNFPDQYVATSSRPQEHVSIQNTNMVFVGYGIVAPEYGWNDYAGIDVRGKTVLALVNDPGYVTKDSTFFTGAAMTYYGRWTYKFEEAARQGASGVLVIHETGPAGYPWGVLRNGYQGSQFFLNREKDDAQACKIEGWITSETAKAIFSMAGYDYDQLILCNTSDLSAG